MNNVYTDKIFHVFKLHKMQFVLRILYYLTYAWKQIKCIFYLMWFITKYTHKHLPEVIE